MRNRINKHHLCIAIFALMLLFLLMQFHQVMVYFDDYGYYSLSYGMETASGGHDFGFSELISFLKVHYFDVNGRLPGYLLWLSLYIIGGLTLVQISAAVFVILILIAVWKFINEQSHPIQSALLVCAFYGLISLNMHYQGTYWFAAFFQYVVPVLFVVLFIILYFKWRDLESSVVKTLLLSMLTFFASYSQEQLSVTVTFMMCLLLIYEAMNKHLKAQNVVYVLIAAAGVAALLLSPSSQNRATSSGLSFVETMIYSTYKTIRTFFAADISLLIILLHLALFVFSVELFHKDKHIFKLMDFAGIVLALISIVIYSCKPLLRILGIITLDRYYLLIVAGVPCIAVIAIQIMRYYWVKKADSKLLLFMTAVGSVGCLCFVPEVPARLFISSWMLLFPLLADGVFCFIDYLFGKHKYEELVLIVICAALVLLASMNMTEIYRGYVANAEIFKQNDTVLSNASEDEKQESGEDKVFLKMLENPNCAAAVVYYEEVTFMKYWMKHYYDFDTMPALYFNETGASDEDLSGYIHQGNQVYLKVK